MKQMSWADFLENAKERGFKCGLYQKFVGYGRMINDVEEEEVILFKEEKGLIIYADSYDQTEIHSATIYGEIKLAKERMEDTQKDAINGFAQYYHSDGTIFVQDDLRTGGFSKTDKLEGLFEFSKSWNNFRGIWLMNYVEVSNRCDHNKIMYQKIQKSIVQVKKIINYLK